MAELAQAIPTQSLAEVCRRFHARRLWLFGSAARGQLTDQSDVDLLAEFEPEHGPSYYTLVEMSEALSPLFGGRSIDLVTRGALHPLIRDYVYREMRVLYEG